MKQLYMFLLSIIIASTAIWGPFYIALVSNKPVKILGSIKQWEEPCSDTPHSESICKTQYRLPAQELKTAPPQSIIGLGVIIHATEIFCANESTPRAQFGVIEGAGKALDLLNIYQTVQLSDINCDKDVIVKVWSPAAYRRFGWIDAPVVISEPGMMAKVRAFIEFFHEPLFLILMALFAGVFLFNALLEKIIGGKDHATPFDSTSAEWLGFMLIYSGALATLFPFLAEYYWYTRLGNFFALCGIACPALESASKSTNVSLTVRKAARYLSSSITPHFNSKIRPIHILMAIFVASPYFARGYSIALLGLSLGGLALTQRLRSASLSFFYLAVLSDALKILAFPSLPSSFVEILYRLLHQADTFLYRLKKSTRLLESMRWMRDQISTSGSNNQSVKDLLETLAKRLNARQISYLILDSGARCRIRVRAADDGKDNQNWNEDEFFKDTIPPIFANVLSTREDLWHIEAKSLFALNLRKGETQERRYNGNYFTVIPLLQGGIPVGALAITNYPDQTALDEIYRLEFESVLSLAVPIITRLVAEETQNQEDEWFSRCQETSQKIRALSNDSSVKLPEALQLAAKFISDISHSGTFLAQLEPATRRVHIQAIAGYPDAITKSYHDTKFYAVSHNEQGPIPLAINRTRIVTIPDVAWIEGVLHKQTLEIFRAFNTRSCAAIPIQPNESEVPWGVLWLESKTIGQFAAQVEPGLRLLTNAIEDLILKISLHGLHERAKSALAGFVPERILQALLAGQNVRETEEGYLLMADLRDSTKLARQYGADAWTEFVGRLCKPAGEIAAKYGYSLQVVVWDALYFTCGRQRSTQELGNAVRMSSELAALFAMEAQKEFREVVLPFDSNRARFCITHGDITRDVKNNFTSNWTIVGNAMASISKMEQTCKGFDGILFCSEAALLDKENVAWEPLPVRAKGTEEVIYRFMGLAQIASVAA